MPYDVTMCTGGDCVLKANCLRFTGAIYGRQNFFGSPPYNHKTGECNHFWDDRPKDSEISEVAYKLWEEEGKPQDRDLEHWYRAEMLLLERNRR
jgi:hypothetical protein